MKSPLTLREWSGLFAGICVGLVISRFFSSDDMTGPWLVILFGPPIALLIASTRPILSWQVPIVTASFVGTFMNRTTDDSAGGALAESLLVWFVCSLLSSPWALIFYYRNRRFRQLNKTPGVSITYVGMVALVFVCCALTFLGFAGTLYFSDADAANRLLPFYGFLAATAGIILSLVAEQAARKLEIQKPVRGVFEVLMIPGILVGIAHVAELFFKSSGRPSSLSAICGMLAGFEALLAMTWLTRLDCREQARTPQRSLV